MTRISTSEFYRYATQSITEQQAKLSRQQLEIASGKSILQPSDDPIGSAQVLGLRSAASANDQSIRNAGQADARLSLEETTLGSISENIQRVRELTIQAANDSQNESTRRSIAFEIEQRLEELTGFANTQDANGEFIFAGNQSLTRPFVNAGSTTVYQGDDGQRFVGIGSSRQIALGDPGSRVFQAVPEGNGTFVVDADAANTGTGVLGTGSVTDITAYVSDDYSVVFTAADQYEVRDGTGTVIGTATYTDGDSVSLIPGIEFKLSGEPAVGDQFNINAAGTQDIFSSYREIIASLQQAGNTAADDAQFRTTINRTLTGLDQAIDHISEVRSDVGSRLQVIDSQVSLNEDKALQIETTRSSIEDLDYTEAISQLQQRLLAFQAAQQSFVSIQGLSLFNFI